VNNALTICAGNATQLGMKASRASK